MTLQSPTAILIRLFPGQSTLNADIMVCWIGKIVRTCAAGGSRILDFLHERRTLYPLGQVLSFLRNCSVLKVHVCQIENICCFFSFSPCIYKIYFSAFVKGKICIWYELTMTCYMMGYGPGFSLLILSLFAYFSFQPCIECGSFSFSEPTCIFSATVKCRLIVSYIGYIWYRDTYIRSTKS